MIGRSELFRRGAGRELFAADVYCGLGTGGAVDAVVDAISWIARARVAVINVSLVGPPNTTLENVVKIAVARGFVIVAAVGNDGAAAPPLYPASYPGVIGVTGVDAREKVLLEACRGPQVDFAAPGADSMAAAMLSPGFAAVRGTSFAAPIVAGLLAAQLSNRVPRARRKPSQLAQQAVDLWRMASTRCMATDSSAMLCARRRPWRSSASHPTREWPASSTSRIKSTR